MERACKTESDKIQATPSWERSKTYNKMWHGSIFKGMILQGNDKEEQRIQRLRNEFLRDLRVKGILINLSCKTAY